jgi:DNA-binding Lrp family transcriptional regulator
MPLSVRAVERALDILLCFSAEEPIQSLSRIAESVRLSKPTVHRLLATLEKKQFIAKDPATSRYRLGIYGHPGDSSGVPFTQKAVKEEIGSSNAMPAFVATAIPPSPQASTRFGSQ